MKRIAIALIVLLAATSLFAGGKACEAKAKHAAKSVELTGTLTRTGSGDAAKTVFRTASGDRSYTVCEQTKTEVLQSAADSSATYRVKGKVVRCGEGEELLIESAKRV